MCRHSRGVLRLVIVLLLTMLIPPTVALADGSPPIRQSAGPYEITARYAVDPPHYEEGNALLIEVRDSRSGQPVTGLENVLKVKGSVFVFDVEKTYQVPLRRSLDQPGLYEGIFVPPALGKYVFDIGGVIDGTPVALQFTSGDGGLPEVTPRTRGDYSEPGVYLALAIALAYFIGLAAILAAIGARKWRRSQHAA